MMQYHSVLKTYADAGMRTIEEWAAMGREVTSGVKPCADATNRGETVALYTRDQTQGRRRPAHEVPNNSDASE